MSKKQTEAFKKYVSKGDLIYIEGKPKMLISEDKNKRDLVIFPTKIIPVLWKKHNLEFTANDIPF